MKEMSAAMEKIKVSAEGTSQIIKDINETKAMAQVNQVTQQNAASSEESSSAASELSAQAEELATIVATFELEQRTAKHVSGSKVRLNGREKADSVVFATRGEQRV
jgi:hypothetical protein